jgi:hypothetical protein
MEKKIDIMVYFCFMFCFFPIWHGLISFLDQWKGISCVNMHSKMNFMLCFTYEFYSCYDKICMFENKMLKYKIQK